MDSTAMTKKPHAVCVPFPLQGHINPMLNLAKLLHHRGFHITFVNTDFNHNRLLKSQGPNALKDLPSFRFETIPDGLPPSDVVDASQDAVSLCDSTSKHSLPPFRALLSKLNDSASSNVPPVTCIVSDGAMGFTLEAARELAIPNALFWTTSTCGLMGYAQYSQLVDKGYTPFKDESYLMNGYMDTIIDWIPGMEGIRLKDLPSFIRTTNPNDIMQNFYLLQIEISKKGSAIILNTFDALEHQILEALSSMLPPIYTVGPLHLLLNQICNDELKSIGSSLWKEEMGCIEWLNSKEPLSVVYINFGSLTVMTPKQLVELAWGLCNSKQTFLWVIRPDLVVGDTAVLPQDFLTETKQRGLLASWCPQEQVLAHPSIGGFLTHSGWNSTIESLSNGVPMICWPFFAEQPTNSHFSCTKWGIGTEINGDIKRDRVEMSVRELIIEEKGKLMKKKAMEWKRMAREATTSASGSSYSSLDKLVNQVLLSPEVRDLGDQLD